MPELYVIFESASPDTAFYLISYTISVKRCQIFSNLTSRHNVSFDVLEMSLKVSSLDLEVPHQLLYPPSLR